MTTISSCDPLALSAAVDQMAENDRMRQAYEQSLQQPICDYTTAQWHYLADSKPELPKDKNLIAVLISRKGQPDSWVALWNGRRFVTVGFAELQGEVYAWSYFPNPAPWIEPEPTA